MKKQSKEKIVKAMDVLDKVGYYEDNGYFIVSDRVENETHIKKMLAKAKLSYTIEHFDDKFGNESVEFKIPITSVKMTSGGIISKLNEKVTFTELFTK